MLWSVVVVCITSLLLDFTTARAPPRAIGDSQGGEVRAKVGQLVKLFCAVEADPPALIQWTKDDEGIHSGWERFKEMAQGTLRIRDVTEEDSGHYTCRAANGFGSISIEHDLYVIADSNVTSSVGVEDEGNNDGPIIAPQFSNPESMQSLVNTPEGSTVRLKCRAQGQPQPTITWYHGNRLLPADDSQQPPWMLKLGDVREDDNGAYTCRVTNRAGSINFTYILDVVTRLSKPLITSPHPMNTSVYHGETATLQCTVVSDVEPTIHWLKRVDEASDVSRNATFRVNGQVLIVLNRGASQMARSDGTYLNKLTLRDVSDTDAGVYICWAGNSAGYNIREAHLIVQRGGERAAVANGNQPIPAQSTAQLPMWVFITVLASVVAVIAAILLVMVCRRHKSQRPPRTNCTPVHIHRGPSQGQGQGQSRSGDLRPYQHDYSRLQANGGGVPGYHGNYPGLPNNGVGVSGLGPRYADSSPAMNSLLTVGKVSSSNNSTSAWPGVGQSNIASLQQQQQHGYYSNY